MKPTRIKLSEKDILSAFQRLDELARAAGTRLEISLYGGAAMILGFNVGRRTYDLDVIIRDGKSFARQAIQTVAEEKGWNEKWLNESIANFVMYTKSEEFCVIKAWENKETGLVVQTAAPQYLLAMKCFALAGRAGEHDAHDVKTLIQACNISDVDAVIAIVEKFFPNDILPSKEKMTEKIASVFALIAPADDNGFSPAAPADDDDGYSPAH